MAVVEASMTGSSCNMMLVSVGIGEGGRKGKTVPVTLGSLLYYGCWDPQIQICSLPEPPLVEDSTLE